MPVLELVVVDVGCVDDFLNFAFNNDSCSTGSMIFFKLSLNNSKKKDTFN